MFELQEKRLLSRIVSVFSLRGYEAKLREYTNYVRMYAYVWILPYY